MNRNAFKGFLEKNATLIFKTKNVLAWVTPVARISGVMSPEELKQPAGLVGMLVEAFEKSAMEVGAESKLQRVKLSEFPELVTWACRPSPSGTTYLLVATRKNDDRAWDQQMQQALDEPVARKH